MKAAAPACGLCLALLCARPAPGQSPVAGQSQNSAQSSTETSGQPSKAPPSVTPVTVQLGACINAPLSSAPRPLSPQQTSAVGQVLFTVVPVPGPNNSYSYTLKCGGLAPNDYPTQFLGTDYSGTRAEVWTAADSKAQFDFLRGEVKSTIEKAVLDKLVQDQLVQESVKRALSDQKVLQDAISDAVDKALKAKMTEITDAVRKQVLDQLKLEQSKTPVQPAAH